MKKIFILSILVIMAVFLYGCMEKTLPTTTTTTSTSTSTTESTTTTTTTSTTTTTAATTGGITGYAVLNDDQTNHSGTTVTAEGNPDSAAITASDGSFTILNIPGGTYPLRLSKPGYATRTVSGITVQNGATANAGTIPIYREYDMSALSGIIKSMDDYDGYLYITTSQKIYKIPVSDPPNTNTSVSNTKEIDSLAIGPLSLDGQPTADYLFGFYMSGPTTNVFITDLSLNTISDSDFPGLTFSAITLATSPDGYLYTNSSFAKIIFGTGDTSSTVNVSESNIVSLDYNNNYFYACDSTSLYQYDSSFNKITGTLVDPLGAGSDIVGIAHDGTYIWLINTSTKKLMKMKD